MMGYEVYNLPSSSAPQSSSQSSGAAEAYLPASAMQQVQMHEGPAACIPQFPLNSCTYREEPVMLRTMLESYEDGRMLSNPSPISQAPSSGYTSPSSQDCAPRVEMVWNEVPVNAATGRLMPVLPMASTWSDASSTTSSYDGLSRPGSAYSGSAPFPGTLPSSPQQLRMPEALVANRQIHCFWVDPPPPALTVLVDFQFLMHTTKHLPMDAGHWRELLRARNRDFIICLLEQYLKHEDPMQWDERGIDNPRKYLTRNLKQKRDLLRSRPDVHRMICDLRAANPVAAGYVDGQTVQYVCDNLLGEVTVRGCASFVATVLKDGWWEGGDSPRAVVYCIVKRYAQLVRAREMKATSPNWATNHAVDQLTSSMNNMNMLNV